MKPWCRNCYHQGMRREESRWTDGDSASELRVSPCCILLECGRIVHRGDSHTSNEGDEAKMIKLALNALYSRRGRRGPVISGDFRRRVRNRLTPDAESLEVRDCPSTLGLLPGSEHAAHSLAVVRHETHQDHDSAVHAQEDQGGRPDDLRRPEGQDGGRGRQDGLASAGQSGRSRSSGPSREPPSSSPRACILRMVGSQARVESRSMAPGRG